MTIGDGAILLVHMTCTIPRFFLFVALFFGFVTTGVVAKASAQEERVAAAFMLGLGRAPLAQEVADWTAKGALPLEKLFEAVVADLASDKAKQKRVTARAFEDAFGESVSKAAEAGTGSYLEQMQGHLVELKRDESAYKGVIERAYQFVIRRDPYEEEIEYWKSKDTLSYLLLVGGVEDWARRNQPGLMVTGGVATVSVNCEFLETLRLSPEVAAEARALVGLKADDGSGQRVVAAGAGELLSSGGVHFVAAAANRR